jgi:hypothetical protein
VKNAKEVLKDVGGTMAQDIAYGRNTNILPWATGGNPKNDQTSQEARRLFNKKTKEASEDDRIKKVLRSYSSSGTPPTPPTTP